MKGMLSGFKTLAGRFWRIYIDPPRETEIYLDVSELPVLTERIALHKTRKEPKQVAIDPERELAFVSCMKGKAVQVFDYSEGKLKLVKEFKFSEQCVEVETIKNLCFVTTTNFARGPKQKSHLSTIDVASGQLLSTVDTGGEWSKVVKLHPNGRLAFVSNWHSHDVSVIDISDIRRPKVLQVVPCGESPRGIDFTTDGRCLVTGFYSARVYTLEKRIGRWEVAAESPNFDPEGYSGNMRDILVAPNGQHAWVSNLGRNLVHRFDIGCGEITDSILVGRHPNSIRFLDKRGKALLVVSCREDDVVCFVDTEKLKVAGRSARTEHKPTGLAVAGEGLLITNFADNTLKYHRVRYD